MKKLSSAACLIVSFLLCGAASGQTISFTSAGTVTENVGSGTATLTPGGAATLGFTVRDTNNDNCDDGFQLVLSISLANGDVLSLQFDPTSGSESGTTQTIIGTLRAIEGGKGAYANLGGSGTMTLVATQSAPKTITFTSNGTVTMGGTLVTKANLFPSGVRNVFRARNKITVSY